MKFHCYLCKINPLGQLFYLYPDLILADEVRRDMDGLLLPTNAAHMEVQSCHVGSPQSRLPVVQL